jgi:antibiotic biosynthesis monooxygenase (ABM) superfamily enzyme
LDNSDAGAAWVFTRSNGVWKQLGSKLVGSGAAGEAWQGFSVALSADGKTAIVGGPADNSNVGAAWVFSRSGAEWSQQGGKLVATDVAGSAKHGYSVALSADGNTAIVGGPYDNSDAGAAWAYGRNGTVWSQQHKKLVGFGATGRAEQGFSVALSADGSTAIAGGIVDNKLTGAAWVHSRSVWAPTSAPFVGYAF